MNEETQKKYDEDEHFKEAYDLGYQQCLKDNEEVNKEAYEEGYEQGLKDGDGSQ